MVIEYVNVLHGFETYLQLCFSNQISFLGNADWSHLKETLDTLFLAENDLHDLPEDSLVSLKRLNQLTLDHNHFHKLKMNVFPESLQTLSVQHNHLSELPLIEPLTKLTRLYLRGNSLRAVPSYSLQNVRQLDKLDIGDNLIASLTSIFNNSLAIRDLNLDSNKITTLSDDVFRGLNAGRIILAMNEIENISDNAFSSLENRLEYIDLELNYLQVFPSALGNLKKLKFLYIPSNQITYLNENVFENCSNTLKALSLAGNQLLEIPQSALAKCVKLAHVNLGYNVIGEIRPQDFIGWGDFLDTLLLQNNRIIRLSNGVFNSTPYLKELSLSFNRLIEIETDIFTDISLSLRSLEMSFSLYQDEFPEDLLKPLKNVVWLSLDNNNLKIISKDALSTLRNLQYINLESNKFIELPVGLFNSSNLHNLKDIRLSYNHINKLSSKSFHSLNNLKSIVLTGNNIQQIDAFSFYDLPRLLTVVLSQNRISAIEDDAFVSAISLRKLDLQINELRDFSLNIFNNVSLSSPLMLNLSRNEISMLTYSDGIPSIRIENLDLSRNKLSEIPSMALNLMAKSLTKLNLGYNSIFQIHPFSFSNLTRLEVLNLQHNAIVSVRRKAFFGLSSLQIIDLSHNHMKTLQTTQFSSCASLRVVDLSSNHIRTMPRDVFQNTIIEKLDLSNNEFVIYPSQTFGDIGFTLRHLDLSGNQIDRLDSTMFYETQFLTNLNMCRNKLSILPDNAFTSLGNLLDLKLCRNSLTANLKELLHYIPKLRQLDLSYTSLRTAPTFLLSKLTHLNLSGNFIDELPSSSVEGLSNLKTLVIKNNRLVSLPSCWTKIPLLKNLDVSSNPIKVSSIIKGNNTLYKYIFTI